MLVYNPCHILVQTCIFGLGDLLRKYYMNDLWLISMTWWFLFNMLNVLWKCMKFKWHAQMKKHELMIAILKCKTCVKKLIRLKWKRILYPFKDFIIQMSLFLYLLNMSTIIRISYPEKSNRVQNVTHAMFCL